MTDLRIPKVKRLVVDRTGTAGRYDTTNEAGLKCVTISIARLLLRSSRSLALLIAPELREIEE